MGAVKLLLDTHAFYWWCIDDPALSLTARTAIADTRNEKYVSAITAWEFTIKFRSGKEPGFSHIAADVSGAVAAQGRIGDYHAPRRSGREFAPPS